MPSTHAPLTAQPREDMVHISGAFEGDTHDVENRWEIFAGASIAVIFVACHLALLLGGEERKPVLKSHELAAAWFFAVAIALQIIIHLINLAPDYRGRLMRETGIEMYDWQDLQRITLWSVAIFGNIFAHMVPAMLEPSSWQRNGFWITKGLCAGYALYDFVFTVMGINAVRQPRPKMPKMQ